LACPIGDSLSESGDVEGGQNPSGSRLISLNDSRAVHDGQPKVFRDSAVENLREFFERFRRLNIRSSPELDEVVQQAQQTINWGRAASASRPRKKKAAGGHGWPWSRARGTMPRKNQPAGAMDGRAAATAAGSRAKISPPGPWMARRA